LLSEKKEMKSGCPYKMMLVHEGRQMRPRSGDDGGGDGGDDADEVMMLMR